MLVREPIVLKAFILPFCVMGASGVPVWREGSHAEKRDEYEYQGTQKQEERNSEHNLSLAHARTSATKNFLTPRVEPTFRAKPGACEVYLMEAS